MTRFTDRDLTDSDLEKIFQDDPMPEPPDDLADRIKAEIPDDLEALFADSENGEGSETTARILPFPGPKARRVLALAAVLVAAAGLALLVRPWEEPRDAISERAVSEGDALPDTPRLDSTETNQPGGEVGAPPGASPPTPDDASRSDADTTQATGDSAGRRSLEEKKRELASRLQELRRVREGAESGEPRREFDDEVTVTGKVPPPTLQASEASSAYSISPEPRQEAPTSGESSGEYRDSAAKEKAGNERLRALGYVGEAEPAPPPRISPPARRLAEERRNPNDAPFDHVYFESAGVNPFVDTEDDALSTFGLDVDTASYTVVRRHLRDGHLPPEDAVRVEEMVNFFDYGDAPPEESDFALHAEGAPSPWGEGERYYLLRFGLRARDVVEAERPPATLVFVVDVSGSMDRENRLGLVKEGLRLLLGHLREDDRVGLVVYGSRGEVLLEPSGDHRAVRRAIDRLRPGGSTNAAEGLRLGYELAARHKEPKRIHRVILCSDGVANTGSTTSSEGILGEVERWARQGIELTTVGFGMGNYNDVLMERLANDGNGRYAYVDTLGEARRLFVEDLTGTLVTVAAEARAQVAFDPEVVSRYRLLGYENRDIADERFRDDTVDAGEIGAGHTVTAVYEIKTREPLRRRDEIATLTLRYASIEKGEMVEQSETIRGRDVTRTFEDAPASLRLAAVVAEAAEILRGSYWAREGDLDEVFRRAQEVSADFPGGADVAEFAALVGRAAEIRNQEQQSRE